MKYNEHNKPLVCMMTQSTCYRGTRKFTPKGILWHSTGANNPTLKRYVQPDDGDPSRAKLLALLGRNPNGNDWNHTAVQAGLNFWIGRLADGTVAAVQTMPWDYRPWGCGSGSRGSGNDVYIQFEICEDGLNDKDYWEACYREACEMTAYLCRMFGIDPQGTFTYNGLTLPTITDHAGSCALGIGTNHGDVQHWSRRYGKTMENVREDVAGLLKGTKPTCVSEAASALSQGDQGDAVKTMQIMLNACGFNCGEADGDFGRNTLAALLAFQTVYGLMPDGVYGEDCKAALEAAYGALPTIMETAKAIWDRLYDAIGNANGVAGAMGNFWKESNLRANNLQNSAERKLGMTDEEYTAAVDNGAYTDFVTDSCGYGLYQSTHEAIKGSMLRFAKSRGMSIGDTDMQVDHFIALMKTEFPTVWKTLTTAKTVREASDAVLLNFERPADQSEKAQKERAAFGEMFLKKYGKPEQKPTGCYASAVIAVAISELGYKEKRSNSSLDDKEANSGSANFTKYARDFDEIWPNFYNGKKQGFAWCDLALDHWFVSAYGYENALRLLCQPERSTGAGCTYSLRYYREKGQFHQYGPKAGDQIFFGTSLDNATHTGLVEKVDGSTVHTIEGNTGDQVARRHYSVYDSCILGYGRPAYDEEESISTAEATSAAQEKVQYYRVRKSWRDKSSQIGAFTRIENAKLMVDSNPGYAVFSEDGRQIYPPVDNAP